jgi:hypothetical protein
VAAEDRYADTPDVAVGRIVGAIDEPIRVGSMLWVFTDPHRGHELAYNRWYERDHYYGGCMIGAANFAGSRWVATRRHKAARLPADPDMSFPRDAGSYACVFYVLDGHHEQWLDWSTPQVHHLYDNDRGFAARTHYNTGTYNYEWRAYRDANPVPLELALDHHYTGLVAQFVSPNDGASREDVDKWFDAYLPEWLPGSPVASVSSWSTIPLLDTKPDFMPEDGEPAERLLLLYFHEDDPLESWPRHERLAADLDDSGVARVALAAPFVATDVGTDRHVDELW